MRRKFLVDGRQIVGKTEAKKIMRRHGLLSVLEITGIDMRKVQQGEAFLVGARKVYRDEI